MPALGAMYGGKDLSGLYLDHSGDRKIAASYLDFKTLAETLLSGMKVDSHTMPTLSTWYIAM